MSSYHHKLYQLFTAIDENNEEIVLKTIINIPLDIINKSAQYIIKKLLYTQNTNILHIFIIYGIDCNCFVTILEAECYIAYIDYFMNGEYEHYYNNPVFCVINNYFNSYYSYLKKWSVNPIYYSIIHNCSNILLDFIKCDIIPLETYFKQSYISGKEQFLKYNPRSENTRISTSSNLENNLFSDCIHLSYKRNEEDFNAKELEHFEIFDKRIANVNMFINDELSMHYNYIYKKKIDISVVYPRKYNEILKTIIIILNRYNDSDHKYYLPEELWLCIIIPMFVTNY